VRTENGRHQANRAALAELAPRADGAPVL